MTEPIGTQAQHVLGLFDDERAADAALSRMAVAGMNQGAIKVIDTRDLDTAEPAIPYPAFKAGASLGPLRPEPESLPGAELAEGVDDDAQRDLQRLLVALPLDDEGAHYYASGVYEGGTLVIVQVADATEAAAVRELLAAAGATSFKR
jgi:hypothetical protein